MSLETPLRVGIRLEPPAVIYVYKSVSRGGDALRMRVMPVRNIWPKSDTAFVLEELKGRHGKRLDNIPDDKLTKMIELIKLNKKGLSLEESLATYDEEHKTQQSKKKNFSTSMERSVKGADDELFILPKKKQEKLKDDSTKDIPRKRDPLTISSSLNRTIEKNVKGENKLENRVSVRPSSFPQPFGEKGSPPTDESESDENERLDPFQRVLNEGLNQRDKVSTSFTQLQPPKRTQQETAPSNFLQQLEESLSNAESPKRTSNTSLKPLVTWKGSTLSSNKNENLSLNSKNDSFNSKPKEMDVYDKLKMKIKNDDDTDVEFSDDDDPLDSPVQDFW